MPLKRPKELSDMQLPPTRHRIVMLTRQSKLANGEVAQSTVLSAVKQVVGGIQGREVLGVLQALAALVLHAAPVPLVALLVDVAEIVRGPGLGLAAPPALAGPLGEQVAGLEHQRRVHGEAAQLEDVLADGRADDVLGPVRVLLAVRPHDLGARAPPAPPVPARRLDLALDDEVRDDVQPLAIPGEDPAPHLEGLDGADLAPEAAEDGAEADAERALDQLAALVAHELVLFIVADNGQPGGEKVSDEVGARDVEIGEVGAVALVHIVVGLEQGVSRRGDAVMEQGAGRQFRPRDDRVVDEGVEDTELWEDVESAKGGVRRRVTFGWHLLSKQRAGSSSWSLGRRATGFDSSDQALSGSAGVRSSSPATAGSPSIRRSPRSRARRPGRTARECRQTP